MTPPPPASDDSAVESMSSSATTSDPTSSDTSSNNKQQKEQKTNALPNNRPRTVTRPSFKDSMVTAEELKIAALHSRTSNSILERSTRTVLSCFDDLDIQRFETRTDYLVNFISNGINRNPSFISRPVSILWPDNSDKLVEEVAKLDAHLIGVSFRERPVDWMLNRGLTFNPSCRQCKDKMVTVYENNTVKWQCQKTQACQNFIMPIQRPSFFSSYEKVGLDKLLFSIYYWAICAPSEDLYNLMKMESRVLDSIWRRLQNVCRNSLEKKYPRHRLTNTLDQGAGVATSKSEPIDLVSIKLNDVYVVCAKHPGSNIVRLGLYIPGVSLYSFADLTDTWFAHGTHVRVAENKFMNLTKKRSDLKVELVTRQDMVTKNGQFCRESAFGYLICQLAHVLKDFQSSSLTRESLKLILAEIEWRELYGTVPFEAFNNIVNHVSEFGETSDWYTEPSLPVAGEVPLSNQQETQLVDNAEYIWAETYYYATAERVDKNGKVICTFEEPPDMECLPPADVRIKCHICKFKFESFDFSLHIKAHLEENRKEHERREYLQKKVVECKHCFKMFHRDHIGIHSSLFRSHLNVLRYGCRICCLKLSNRAAFLQHMRRVHFEHETPYHCPSCKFASSFQRTLFIHFQEEHRHTMVILCPLCLRSFTVREPGQMDEEKMTSLSTLVYNHLAEHYITSKGFTCSNCCLCFLNKDELREHKKKHHDPCEVRPADVRVDPFIVCREEEEFCVKAIPMELFIANKRPNLALDQSSRPATQIKRVGKKLASQTERKTQTKRKHIRDILSSSSSSSGSSSSSDSSSSPDTSSSSSEESLSDTDSLGNNSFDSGAKLSRATKKHEMYQSLSTTTSSSSSSSSEDDVDEVYRETEKSQADVNTIHVRGHSDVTKFLDGGRPALEITRTSSRSTISPCTSQKIIEKLSRMKQADGILPNQSVILTPKGRPAKCNECFQFITAEHFVALISCKSCKYGTHCPRAAIAHKKTKHSVILDVTK